MAAEGEDILIMDGDEAGDDIEFVDDLEDFEYEE
jgi:hypothetical protein